MKPELYTPLFDRFVAGSDTLRVYRGDKLLFASQKDRLLPLLEYIAGSVHADGVVVFDRIMGNAAALLVVKAGCAAVYSPLGSELAARTLDRHGITWHFTRVVPFVEKPGGGICPMERLSLDKEPEEFYMVLRRGEN